MKVLVTGGSGFIGSRLVADLHKLGHEVSILDLVVREAARGITIQGDIRNKADCLRAASGMDAVFHLAALFGDDVKPDSLYYDVNRDGTFNVLEACALAGVRTVVFVSSFSVYGLDNADSREDAPLRPVSHYGISKTEAEQGVVKWVNEQPGRSASIVRPSVVFGEGNRGNVWVLGRQIAEGRFVLLGSGNNLKSMAYVGNLAAFLAGSLGRAAPGVHVYNYADKPDMAVGEIVDTIATALQRRVPRIPVPRAALRFIGMLGDTAQRVFGYRGPVNSERVEKFFAQTLLPVARVQASGFVPPFEMRKALVSTMTGEFGRNG